MSGRSAGCWWTIAIPRSCAVAGVRCSTGSPARVIVAAVGRRRARRDVHQRRLAGPVLPEEGMHLAWENVERDVRQRRDRGVVLRDVAQRQRRLDRALVHRDIEADGGFIGHADPGRPSCARRPDHRRAQRPLSFLLLHQLGLRGRRQLGGEVDVTRQVWPCTPPGWACRSSSPRRRATGSACSPASCRPWRARSPSPSRGARGRSASRP